ncbi:MAG: hypothetical protein MUE82_07230 [Chloroflexi bacterium]|jgi:hypothetical protein|nr:hypothetical protein [Chloroflexota bacterium]
MTADPRLAGVGLSRRAHLGACAALAAVVVAGDMAVEPVVPVLVLLIVAATIAGFLRPDGIVTAGLIVGLAIPVVRMCAALLGADLASSPEPAGPAGAASLVVLVVPALFGAVIGGFARRTLEEERLRRR